MDLKKTQADAKHYNENIMTIVVPGVKMDFYWLPKASGYAIAFMSVFQDESSLNKFKLLTLRASSLCIFGKAVTTVLMWAPSEFHVIRMGLSD